jgi:spore coat polysaccharide biosynthesis protein SpsF
VAQAIFVTARTGSSRLPRKALQEVGPGITALDWLLDRLRSSRSADAIVLCTTDLPEDDVLAETGLRHGVDVYRGSVEDKLQRWLGAAEHFGVERFITADGDDLLCDPHLIDQGMTFLRDGHFDFIEAPDAPCGAFTYGISVPALARVCAIKKTDDTEMMWVYFKETGLFRLGTMPVEAAIRRPDLRLTLDYPEDLEFFRTVLRHFNYRRDVGMPEVVRYLEGNPSVTAINAFRQSEFLENQARRTHLEI